MSSEQPIANCLPRHAASAYWTQELFGEIEEARESGNHVHISEIEQEMEFLAKAIEGGKALGGYQRRASNKRKNVRDAFRNAIDRAIKQTDKYDKPLAAHLKGVDKHGNEVVYRPEMVVTWEVCPAINE